MADEVRTVPYEVLIRWNEDGILIGAHQERRRIVEVDGVIEVNRPLGAEPLGIENFPLSEVMTKVTEDALKTIDTMKAIMVDMEKQIGSLTMANETLTNAKTALESEVAKLEGVVAGQRAEVTRLEGVVAGLNAQIDILTQPQAA